MKIQMTVNIDWLSEDDGTIDEVVKQELVSRIRNEISEVSVTEIRRLATVSIEKAAQDAMVETKLLIAEHAKNFATKWLTEEVTITDKFGTEVETGNLETIIKRHYQQALDQPVDKNGRPTQSSYDSRGKLINWLVRDNIHELVNSQVDDLKKHIDTAIKEQINTAIKRNVSDRFAEMVIQTAQSQLPHKDS